MAVDARQAVLFLVLVPSLVLMSSAFICLQRAEGCAGGCAVSGGGESSYNFMGDRAVDMDMPGFDEFVRDNVGNHQTTLRTGPLSRKTLSNASSTLNQTAKGNVSQNSSTLCGAVNSPGNATFDNRKVKLERTVKLGASGARDGGLSTLAFTAFNNNML